MNLLFFSLIILLTGLIAVFRMDYSKSRNPKMISYSPISLVGLFISFSIVGLLTRLTEMVMATPALSQYSGGIILNWIFIPVGCAGVVLSVIAANYVQFLHYKKNAQD